MSEAISDKHHLVDLTLPPSPLIAEVDAVRLHQVFTNLLMNAVNTRLQEDLSRLRPKDSKTIDVSIRNDGVGIAPAMHKAVFDFFTQVEPTAMRTRALELAWHSREQLWSSMAVQ